MGHDSNAVITGPGLYVRADGGAATVLDRGHDWRVVLHGIVGGRGRDLTLYYEPNGHCNIGHCRDGGCRPDGEIIVCPADQWMTPPPDRPNLPDRTVVDVRLYHSTKRLTVGDICWCVMARYHARWRVPNPDDGWVRAWRDQRKVNDYAHRYSANRLEPGRSAVRRFADRAENRCTVYHAGIRPGTIVDDVVRQGTAADALARRGVGVLNVPAGRIDRLGVVRDQLEPGDVAELRDGKLYKYEGER